MANGREIIDAVIAVKNHQEAMQALINIDPVLMDKAEAEQYKRDRIGDILCFSFLTIIILLTCSGIVLYYLDNQFNLSISLFVVLLIEGYALLNFIKLNKIKSEPDNV